MYFCEVHLPEIKPKYKIGETYKVSCEGGKVKDCTIRDIYKDGNGYVYEIESAIEVIKNRDKILQEIKGIEYVREDEILVRYRED